MLIRFGQMTLRTSELSPLILLCPHSLGGAIKRWCSLTSVCLSVAYIGNNSRTKRLRKTKIGTQVAHVTGDSDTTFKLKRSKVNLQGRRNIVADSRTSLIFINSLIFMAPTAIGSKARWRRGWAADGPQRPAYSGRGHIVSPRAQLVTQCNRNFCDMGCVAGICCVVLYQLSCHGNDWITSQSVTVRTHHLSVVNGYCGADSTVRHQKRQVIHDELAVV